MRLRYLGRKLRLTMLLIGVWLLILHTQMLLFAQDTPSLVLNTPIHDTFAGTPLAYTLNLESTDPLVVTLHAVDPLGDLQFPTLTLNDAEMAAIATTRDHIVRFGQTTHQATLFIIPPEIGDYQLLVDRLPETDSTGEFILQVHQPQLLDTDQPINAEITSDAGYDFYLVDSTSDFNILYEKLSGDYAPEVRVNRVSENGELLGIGYLAGDELTQGTLGRYTANSPYIISVGWLTSSFLTNRFQPEIVSSEYQLMLQTE